MSPVPLLLALAILVVSASASAIPPLGCPGRFEAEVVVETNLARAAGQDCGSYGSFPPADPVQMDVRLNEAAALHTDDMISGNFVSHTGSDDGGPGDRIDATTYSWWTWGENIAAGQPSPAQVVAAWVDSDGHCANLMNANLTHLGVGYGYGPGTTYGHYWTQVFARPAGGNSLQAPTAYCPACSNTLDDDGDGLTDYEADPGCFSGASALEAPACQDGVDNDGLIGIDFDGGASANGGVPLDVPDPQCTTASRNNEAPSGAYCGLGAESRCCSVASRGFGDADEARPPS